VSWLPAEWPAPGGVHAGTTTREGGVSRGAFASFNLGAGVGDDPDAVVANRARLVERLALPAEPAWLAQVHGTRVVELGAAAPDSAAPGPADAAFTRRPGRGCTVLTADCLPVVLCDAASREVAVAHAGWRGLAAGVLEATIARLAAPPGRLLAWLGPAIGPAAFEVGDEVRAAFVDGDPGAAAHFTRNPRGRWQADLDALARRRLGRAGVGAVHGGGWCTASDRRRFYSHRRDGRCGRMATLAWLTR